MARKKMESANSDFMKNRGDVPVCIRDFCAIRCHSIFIIPSTP